MSYSDSLAQLISKIDFDNLNEEKTSETTQQQKSTEKGEIITARKFYQSVQEKVKWVDMGCRKIWFKTFDKPFFFAILKRLAFDEVSVLLDCLTIAKADQLIGIETRDHVSAYSPEEKPSDVSDKTLTVVLKKKVIVLIQRREVEIQKLIYFCLEYWES